MNFVAETLGSMNKLFQEYFLNDLVFRLVGIQKSINKIFEKQLHGKSIFKVGSSKSITRILEKKFGF